MAAIVVFCTTYAMILPAITLEVDRAGENGAYIMMADSAQEAADEAAADTEEAVQEEPAESEVRLVDDQLDEAAAAEETADVNMPARSFEAKTDDVKVMVEADEGVFPAGTTMEVTAVNDAKILKAIKKAVRGEVKQVRAVDIIFNDAEGREIEPAAEIRVKLTSDVIKNIDEPVIVHVDKKGRGEIVRQLDTKELKKLKVKPAKNEVLFDSDEFSVYAIVEMTIEQNIIASDGNDYRITVTCGEDAGIPEDAELTVKEIPANSAEFKKYLGKSEKTLGWKTGSATYARLFDISIVKDGEELEPKAAVDVKIELLDGKCSIKAFEVVHFSGTEEKPVKMDTETDGNAVSFSSESFSAYAIVQGPEALPIDWHKLSSIEELIGMGSEGVYIGHPDGYYYGNTLDTVNNRTGITKTKPAQSTPPTARAAKYYFERAEGSDNRVYAYCYAADGTTKQYVYNGGNNSLSFTTNEANKTAFTVTQNSDGTFMLNNGSWYWNMQGGANGTRFCSYNNASDNNNKVNFWYYDEADSDPYGLDGRSCGLMNWAGGVAGKAMMASEGNGNTLDAKSLTVMSTEDGSQRLFVPNNSDISMWTFHWIENDKYYLTAESDGGTKYLKIGENGLSLVNDQNDASMVQVIPGTGIHAGEICLKTDGSILTYSGSVDIGFSVGGSVGSEWLHMVELSELTDEYYMTYSASKVSVSDPGITNASRIIVYTRSWNEEKKKYEFYAIGSDGKVVPVYESGDSIEWVGGRLNTLLWNFTEYYWEGTSDLNYYYELYNQYSEKFVAPQVTEGQILSDDPIGINLNGRRDGQYYSTILAWDEEYYSYVGYKVEDGKIVSCPKSEAMDFYFAVMQDQNVDDKLTTVPTLDHVRDGITMRMKDFSSRAVLSNYFGSDVGGAVFTTVPNLLSTNLGPDGYPTAHGGSLGNLFAGSQEVNHLFIESIYKASGYYEYNSAQNFASLKGATGGDFTVYKELGSYDSVGSRPTLKHGQFFPYNDLQAGVFTSTNGKNLYTISAEPLPDGDPRKNEQLYSVEHGNQKVNCQFGMELEASFTQTPDGHDDWGHDIIFEFTGDDDFWLYVDGELVIDLGGIHSALAGSVNFKTGDVYINGTHTTLRELFESNYRGRNPNASDAEVAAFLSEYFDEGSEIFKPNTTHTMKIFYFERGAGASNLHMRFNLASIRPGTVLLNKELDGLDEPETVLAEFPYQILYKTSDEPDAEEHYLKNALYDDEGHRKDYVLHKGTVTPVRYIREGFSVAGISYDNVFLLKPGETAEISFPEGTTSYRIVECGVNTDVYENVEVNDGTVTGTRGANYPSNREDYGIGYATTDDRARVTYKNTANPDAVRNLTFTKLLFKENGVDRINYPEDLTTFGFRLYLATEFEELAPTNMHTYHVKDPDGYYCRWDAANQKFEATQYNDYGDIPAAEKESVSFHTSINGSISRIPIDHTVEIRNVLAGTRFRVQERPGEIPDGYSFQKYVSGDRELFGGDAIAEAGVADAVVANVDPHVDICNLKGWGLRVNKIWTDADYMAEREETYFAVFTEGESGQLTLVPDSLRRMTKDVTTLYWYYQHLPLADTEFEQYVIREVKIEGGEPAVDDEGVVTNESSLTVTPVADGDEILLQGRQKGETDNSSLEYTVLYAPAVLEDESNVRVDTVTNSRPGVVLKKTSWNGVTPLAGAVFTLTDSGGSIIGTFTSDSSGLITMAFLNEGSDYTLTETVTPRGYHGLQQPMTIRISDGEVIVDYSDEDYYSVHIDENSLPTLTIKNRPYELRAVKVDGDSMLPMEGVTFSLHKQHTVDGVVSIDLDPMIGYETLTTDENGCIPEVNEDLLPGTYAIHEISTPDGYLPLPTFLQFTVSETGVVSWDTDTSDTDLSVTEQSDGSLLYGLTVYNRHSVSIVIRKVDENGDTLPGAEFKLFRYGSSWEAVPEYGDIDLSVNASRTLSNLKVGRYRLTETGSPDGYVILSRDIFFNVLLDDQGAVCVRMADEDGNVQIGDSDHASASGNTLTVINRPGEPLPNSGGSGTAIFALSGLTIMAGATAMLIRKRKTEQ